MQEFVANHPGVVTATGGAVLTVISWALLKIWGLMRENRTLRDDELKRNGDLLAGAIKDLEGTMHTALNRLTAMIERVDSRHDELVSDIYNRLNVNEVKLEKLVSEHDSRQKTCPGKMVLDQWLSDGRLERRHVE